MSTTFPFTAVVGSDDLALALILNAISPSVGGVLVRGEKGTAKSTMVRALPEVLPPIQVIDGCRFSCAPQAPASDCPDGPHTDAGVHERPARLVELPIGASEDRVTGSMDLAQALGAGQTTFHPGLLAEAHRGLLYVDEVNLLGDHLVDVLLDAAAMGRNSVERDGISVSHPARFVLIGTMNPEEGELRPQLLDRFGLSVDVAASREPDVRAEVVRRRLAFDDDPDAFIAQFATAQKELSDHVAAARTLLDSVNLSDWALRTIARVCAGFDVDGMRADIVLARTATAHAAWAGRTSITRADIRAAALLALSHRQRRGPFDPPGLDEEKLDRLLDEEPEPDPSDDPSDEEQGDGSSEGSDDSTPDGGEQSAPDQAPSEQTPENSASENSTSDTDTDTDADTDAEADKPSAGQAPTGLANAGQTFATQRFEVSGIGRGEGGNRSRSETQQRGRIVGVSPRPDGRVHLSATIRAAVQDNVRDGERLVVTERHLTRARLHGRESNLVLFCVDASGSMAARKRMGEVKTAILSLLQDAYERRDKVSLVCFRGQDAQLVLPPTSSVDLAAARLAHLEHGGRTPLAEGLELTVETLQREARKDPHRRPLVVLVTDGRATAGPDALEKATRIADVWTSTGYETIVINCETGRFRMNLAGQLADRMHATHVPLEKVSAHGLLDAIASARRPTTPDGKAA